MGEKSRGSNLKLCTPPRGWSVCGSLWRKTRFPTRCGRHCFWCRRIHQCLPEQGLNPCGTLQFVPGTSTGCSTIFAQKGIPKMEQLSARLLLTAGILLLIAGVILAILQVWLYTGLLWAGAFGCLLAALNFRNSKNDGG